MYRKAEIQMTKQDLFLVLRDHFKKLFPAETVANVELKTNEVIVHLSSSNLNALSATYERPPGISSD